jgi:hypothetical protein
VTGPPDREVQVVLPGDVDDPALPSGGNVYDRRVCRALPALGWRVRTAAVTGSWPRPDTSARGELHRLLDALPGGALVLVDGLVACGVPEIVVPAARRLRLAVLVHLPLAAETGLPATEAAELDRRERAVLAAASAVVVTGRWAARSLAERGELDAGKVHLAEPGVDPAPVVTGTAAGSGLLCVASLTRRKAQDVLVEALALADRPLRCVLAGPQRDPGFAAELRALIDQTALTGSISLVGPLAGADLEAAYAGTDLAVLVSHAETYGMAVTEALARGIPVVVSDAGALPDTLGHAADGSRPGLVVPAGRADALAAALRQWFDDPPLRETLRRSALGRRAILTGWDDTARHLHRVLDGLRTAPTAVSS